MPTSITFCDADPQQPFRPTLHHAMEDTTAFDVAVAFVTRAGVDFFLDEMRRLPPECCRLSVSVQFPTDLAALCDLSQRLGDNLHIHMGPVGPQEESGDYSGLMHSKIAWLGREEGRVTIFVGSHNWTLTALDGLNLEAGTRVECQVDDAFAKGVKAHLDACFFAGVRFDPDNLEFYQELQHDLYPKRPRRSQREAISDFAGIPSAPALVIHAEDHRATKLSDLLLYLPLDGGMRHDWFEPTVRTPVYLYLYPPGTLLGHRPPAADPSLFEGTVTAFGWADAPITGQANGQIEDLHRPVLMALPSGKVPPPGSGTAGQAVARLHYRGDFPLPVYATERPGVRVEVRFDEVVDEQHALLKFCREPMLDCVSPPYAPGSVSDNRFVLRQPRPSRCTTIQLSGEGFYRAPVKSTLEEYLARRYKGIEVAVDGDELPPPYLYQVRFVFRPPEGTHTGSAI